MREKKILFAIAGIVSLLLTGYLVDMTHEKETVLNTGKLKDAVVSKFGRKPKGGSKTLSVTFKGKEYYMGSRFGEYKHASIGDTVKVFHVENVSSLVILGTRSFTIDYFLCALLGVAGILSLLGSVFYKEKKKHYVASFDYSKGKINKSKLSLALKDSIPNEQIYYKYDKESVLFINRRIKDLYIKYSDLLLLYIEDGLKAKDFRVEIVLNSLLEDSRFIKNDLLKFFRKTLKYYVSTKDEFYHSLIDDFVLSAGAEVVLYPTV